jgi:hypothetical protein
MALTISDVMTRARERYNSVGDDFFSDPFMRDAIYDAQKILAREGLVIQRTYQTPVLAGIREYAFPENTISIKEIRHNFDKLKVMPLVKDVKTDTTDTYGTPRAYMVFEKRIILMPNPVIPDLMVKGDTTTDLLQIRVFCYPQDLPTNVSPIEVPEDYTEDLLNYVLHLMAEKDQNTTMSDRYLQKWEKRVLEVKSIAKRMFSADMNRRVKDFYFGSDTPITSDEVFYNGWTV